MTIGTLVRDGFPNERVELIMQSHLPGFFFVLDLVGDVLHVHKDQLKDIQTI